jgi:hypothetical protein
MSRYIRIQQKTFSRSEPLISNDIDVIRRAAKELNIDFDSLELKAFKKVLYVISKVVVDVYEDSCNKKRKTEEFLVNINRIKELNERISQILNIPYEPKQLPNKLPTLPLTIEAKKEHYLALAKAKGYCVEENNEDGKIRIKLVKS